MMRTFCVVLILLVINCVTASGKLDGAKRCQIKDLKHKLNKAAFESFFLNWTQNLFRLYNLENLQCNLDIAQASMFGKHFPLTTPSKFEDLA